MMSSKTSYYLDIQDDPAAWIEQCGRIRESKQTIENQRFQSADLTDGGFKVCLFLTLLFSC